MTPTTAEPAATPAPTARFAREVHVHRPAATRRRGVARSRPGARGARVAAELAAPAVQAAPRSTRIPPTAARAATRVPAATSAAPGRVRPSALQATSVTRARVPQPARRARWSAGPSAPMRPRMEPTAARAVTAAPRTRAATRAPACGRAALSWTTGLPRPRPAVAATVSLTGATDAVSERRRLPPRFNRRSRRRSASTP